MAISTKNAKKKSSETEGAQKVFGDDLVMATFTAKAKHNKAGTSKAMHRLVAAKLEEQGKVTVEEIK
jgi:hypothetical protein